MLQITVFSTSWSNYPDPSGALMQAKLQREKAVTQVSLREERVPGASWGILYILIIAGRAVGLDTSSSGESWSVVMTVIMQLIDKLTSRNALLVLLQKRKMKAVTVEGSLGSSDCELTEFKILREVSKTKIRIATVNFKRADFGLFWNLGKIPWETFLEDRGPGDLVGTSSEHKIGPF